MVPDYLTIAEAAKLIQQRELSPVELVDGRLARIEKLDSRIHSFIRVLADSARAEARAAESEITAGKYRGPLHGIPIGLKDIYETAGIATTGHSKVMQDHVPKADAFSVRKLRDAGAVVMGKLATHEFALGGPSFDLPWPPARNPWDTARFTGGSSSGTGASVAPGLVLGGTGSDTGGSIRGPAAFCGLAGIKPTYGLVSRTGILPLAGLGCAVRDISLSALPEWSACGKTIMLCEAYSIHEANLRRRFTDFGENFRDRMVLGGLVSGADYVQALRRRRELVAEFDRAMQSVDILMTAAAPSEAPPIDQVPKFALFERPSLTIPFNLTGSPAMSVCCGYTEAGLPLSFQIVGKRFEDATVLRLAHAYEQATSWRGRRPNLQ